MDTSAGQRLEGARRVEKETYEVRIIDDEMDAVQQERHGEEGDSDQEGSDESEEEDKDEQEGKRPK